MRRHVDETRNNDLPVASSDRSADFIHEYTATVAHELKVDVRLEDDHKV